MLAWIKALPAKLTRVSSSTTYIPQIDGLRFLSLFFVLYYHTKLHGEKYYAHPSDLEAFFQQYIPHGWPGVTLFFFISGYIIAYPFLSGRPPALKRFFWRRLTRLAPPYMVAMIGCFLVLSIGFAPSPEEGPSFHFLDVPLWQSLLASLTYTHSILFGEHPRLNPPMWTLEREVQFYIIAPFLLYAYGKMRAGGGRLLVGTIFTVVFMAVGSYISHYTDRSSVLANSLLQESYGFLLGILVCDYGIQKKVFAQPGKSIFDVGFVVGCIGLLATGILQFRLPFLLDVVCNHLFRSICIFLLFLAAVRGTWSKAFLGRPWIALLGGACYSIYLVHMPILIAGALIVSKFVVFTSLAETWLISWIVLVPLVLTGGLLFYALIERPCMDSRWPEKLWQGVVVFFRGPRKVSTVNIQQ